MIWCWQLWPLMLRSPFLEAPWTLTPSLTHSFTHPLTPQRNSFTIYHLVWSEQSSRVMKDYMYTAAAAVGFLQLGAAAADSSDINLMVSGGSLTHSLTHSLTQILTLHYLRTRHSSTLSLNQSINHILAHTLSHTHTHTHSLTHSFTHRYFLCTVGGGWLGWRPFSPLLHSWPKSSGGVHGKSGFGLVRFGSVGVGR